LNNIKTEFTIKDLENFSGIKAHTIRIWEKRYNLFEPQRTESNIRYYNIDNLKKLLNVTLLYNSGLKISKIAGLSKNKMEIKVKEIVFKVGFESSALNSFKLAMLNFDEPLFNQTYNSLIAHSSFRTIFSKIFLQFLNEIGVLWMVNSITPAHEHFIINLIKQKLYLNIEKLQLINVNSDSEKYVLFLPLNEIHELGLLYVHFELLFQGKHSIYLGQSVPVENLKDLQNVYKDICFVTYLTVEPSKISIEEYLDEIFSNVLKNTSSKLWVTGYKLHQIQDNYQIPGQISLFPSPLALLNIP